MKNTYIYSDQSDLGDNPDRDHGAHELVVLGVVQGQLDRHGDLGVALLNWEVEVVHGVLSSANRATGSLQTPATVGDVSGQRVGHPQGSNSSIHLGGERLDLIGYTRREGNPMKPPNLTTYPSVEKYLQAKNPRVI